MADSISSNDEIIPYHQIGSNSNPISEPSLNAASEKRNTHLKIAGNYMDITTR
jgi:hypothetical protein